MAGLNAETDLVDDLTIERDAAFWVEFEFDHQPFLLVFNLSIVLLYTLINVIYNYYNININQNIKMSSL